MAVLTGANTTGGSFADFLKTKYAQNIVNTVPEQYVLQRDCSFGAAGKIGEQIHQAVITQLEHGGTYAAGGIGAFELNAAQAGSIDAATINSTQFMLKSIIDHETLAKAVAKGELAYGSSGDQLLKSMAMSARKRLEIDLWHGASVNGIGVAAGAEAGTNLTFDPASYAPGNYVGMEGAQLEVFQGTGHAIRANVNTITSVDIVTRSVTVANTWSTALQANDVAYFGSTVADAGASNQRGGGQKKIGENGFNTFEGLVKIAGYTSGDTLFNISTDKSVWKPEAYDVQTGVITFGDVQKAAVYSAIKGVDSTLCMYVSVDTWTKLMTDEADNRRYGGEFDGRVELINGGNAIKFWSSTGPIEIKPSIYCPLQEAYLCQKESMMRVGATDVTFKVPGMNEPLMVVSDTHSGVSLFCYYNQALFTATPGQIVRVHNFANA